MAKGSDPMLGELCGALIDQNERMLASFRKSIWAKLDELEKDVSGYAAAVDLASRESGIVRPAEPPAAAPLPPAPETQLAPKRTGEPDEGEAVGLEEFSELQAQYAAIRPLAQADDRMHRPPAVLQISGGLTPGSTIELIGLDAELRARLENGEVPVWSRVVAGAKRQELPTCELQHHVTAEDVGASLRAELAGQVAVSDGLVLPHRPTLLLLKEKLKKKLHEAKVMHGDRPVHIQLQPDQVRLVDNGKLLHKQTYAGNAVGMYFLLGSETGFVLVMGHPHPGSRRKEFKLIGTSRPQRDMIMLALCAFSCPGWLDAALDGSPPPVARIMEKTGKPSSENVGTPTLSETSSSFSQSVAALSSFASSRRESSLSENTRLKKKLSVQSAFTIGTLFKGSNRLGS
ncbi:hypothetical protein AB1Y20_019044 [Prymnesium parvum]|uniref:FACT complex subunit n=1 Tax=Prymnesium parvum TaxID=97485 RepID=A0AB34JRC5_PRYPA